ncbi:hypothetical protein CWO89_24350 [Bradyrhizobium sp. Leo170]|nr:hypothetical protein CWO89_24350 [Bradyrhizobium sp. Leo170]
MDAGYLGHLWALTPHVSRCCFARVLACEGGREERVYRCSNCGSQAEGGEARVLCACGSVLADGSDARIRCQVNEDPTPEYPGEIVAAELGNGP